MKLIRRVMFLTAVAFAVVCPVVSAESVTIAWRASADADVAGYIVQYGEQPQVYGQRVDAGRLTTLKLQNFEVGTTYYFAVQAYTSDGTVGPLSAEIMATVRAGAGAPRGATDDAAGEFAGARLLAPIAGQRGVTSAQVFEWNAVPEAEGYYLTIGTEPGARDIAHTKQSQQTWSTVLTLPAQQRLYASVWTKHAGTWSSTDTEFDSAPKSMLVYPYDTANDTSADETFLWSRVTDATSYYLHVGTTPGGKDIADTGETTAVSFDVKGLQPDQTLYASIHSLVKDVWQVDAVTFTTSLSARFTRPLAGDGSDLGQGLAWTRILGAEGYSVQVGSAPGLGDLLDSGEVLRTSVDTPALPAGKPLYATISTKHGGEWRSRDATVTLAGAALVLPATRKAGAGATIDNKHAVFTWTTISNAQAYYLYVGTAPGAKDVVDSGETQATSFTAKSLPAGTRLHVSVWTKADGVWNGTSSTVTAR